MSFKEITRFAVCALALAHGVGCGGGSASSVSAPVSPAAPAFRSVADVTAYYSSDPPVRSQVISSRANLERVITQQGLNNLYSASDPLILALRAANVNFDQEALVLLEQTSGGGPYQITLDPPVLQGKTFFSTIRTTEFGSGGAAIVSFKFFVFAVSRAQIDTVRVAVFPKSHGPDISLTVPR